MATKSGGRALAKRQRRKLDKKGRGEGGQYFVLPYGVAQSAAWRSMSGPAVKVWVELRCRFNGSNNGRLTLSLDEAARLLGIGKATAQRAFAELEAKGFDPCDAPRAMVRSARDRMGGDRPVRQRRNCDARLEPLEAAHGDWQKIQISGFRTIPLVSRTGPLENREPDFRAASAPVGLERRYRVGSRMDR